MLYVESRKSLKVRREKNLFICRVQKTLGKIISLPSAKWKHSTNLLLCRVPLTDTRQTPNGRHTNWRMSMWRFFAKCLCFAECFFLICRVVFFQHSAKSLVCRVPLFCRVWFLQHSANILALGKSSVSGSVKILIFLEYNAFPHSSDSYHCVATT